MPKKLKLAFTKISYNDSKFSKNSSLQHLKNVNINILQKFKNDGQFGKISFLQKIISHYKDVDTNTFDIVPQVVEDPVSDVPV